jgi:hypothetical protein
VSLPLAWLMPSSRSTSIAGTLKNVYNQIFRVLELFVTDDATKSKLRRTVLAPHLVVLLGGVSAHCVHAYCCFFRVDAIRAGKQT